MDKEVALRDANQQFAKYVRAVEGGQSFVITRRGKPVARLVPIEPGKRLLTPEQQSQITWIAESKPIPAHAVIARPGLDPALKEKFVAAMLELNEPENRWLLKHVYGPDGYVRADPAAYEPVAEVARRHGLLS